MGCFGSKDLKKGRVFDPRFPNPNYKSDDQESTFKAATGKTDAIRFNPKDVIVKKKTFFHADYEYIRDLGKGSFGEVVCSKHRKTKIERAVKVFEMGHMSDSEKESVFQEIEILRLLDHPHIATIHEYYEGNGHVFLVEELYTGGELLDRVLHQIGFTEIDAARYISEILSAVSYCHKRNVVHRDLKPANILFDNKDKSSVLKLVDFGVSAIIEPEKKLNNIIGTILYMAPEVLQKSYNQKCDIWSIGVITYLLLIGKHPFKGANREETAKLIPAGKYLQDGPNWESLSPEAKNFIAKTLQVDPSKRYSADEALKDPWMLQLAKNEIIKKPIDHQALENLRSFSADTKLQEAFYIYISTHFSLKEERQMFLSMFKAMDKNGDGTISQQELLEKAQDIFAIRFSEAELNEIIQKIDLNKNGVIDYSEFLVITTNRSKLLQEQRLISAFEIFDGDKDGVLSVDEIKSLFEKNLGDQDWINLVKEIDENKDGKVSFKEFKVTMLKFLAAKE